MIAARLVLLLVAIGLAAAGWGAFQMHQQPSAQRVLVTSIAALVTPLFWPGIAARTLPRIAAWSFAGAATTAVLLLVIGRGRQSIAAVLPASAMLMLVLALVHAGACAVESRLRKRSMDARVATNLASMTAVLALTLLGAAPLWLGPAAELANRTHAWAVDAVIAVSPLTHLALASGNDLLRNEWLYDHSNLAKLAVTYPAMSGVIATYLVTLFALLAMPLAQRNFRRRISGANPPCSTTEEVR